MRPSGQRPAQHLLGELAAPPARSPRCPAGLSDRDDFTDTANFGPALRHLGSNRTMDLKPSIFRSMQPRLEMSLPSSSVERRGLEDRVLGERVADQVDVRLRVGVDVEPEVDRVPDLDLAAVLHDHLGLGRLRLLALQHHLDDVVGLARLDRVLDDALGLGGVSGWREADDEDGCESCRCEVADDGCDCCSYETPGIVVGGDSILRLLKTSRAPRDRTRRRTSPAGRGPGSRAWSAGG